ncbi:MAG: acetylxylan esterase, partial [Prevotellaceae bacterium]|nr:acetylxylan esterase [Prevotellaceae bacterium]
MKKYCMMAIALMMSVAIHAQRENWKVADKGPSIDNYFTPATSEAACPDNEGFIRRWTLLEPIDKPNRGNTVFTDSYIKQHLGMEYFKGQFSLLPKNGQKVKVGKQKLQWHKMDSKLYNVKLFRFATGLDKKYYGIVFLATTVIECDKDID